MTDMETLPVWAKVPPQFCSGGDCAEIAAIGGDWFRVRSTAHRAQAIALSGPELRAFIAAVKAGWFDEFVAPSS